MLTAMLLTMFQVESAEAHVKWFCAFDVAERPMQLGRVICPDFNHLVGLSVFLLFGGCLVENSILGSSLLRALDRATLPFRLYTETIVRAVACCFFTAVGLTMHVFLTPELTTDMMVVPWLQLAIAGTMLSRRTLPYGAGGIVLLYALAIQQYGIFHLMDYPIFLGIAAYLACTGLRKSPFGVRPLDLLRWAAAITLMWASIEKWAYPGWTMPLFTLHPTMNFGFDVNFYMLAAGAVEFTLAFCLLWTPLVRRSAALILTGTFIAAIQEFGLVDAIGHSCIIAVLIALAADDARVTVRTRTVLLAPVGYSAALIAFMAVYYGAHALLFDHQFG